MAKVHVGIMFGGISAEHEVSLLSAKNIVEALDRARFDVSLIGIDKQGRWHLNDASDFLLHAEDPSLIALNQSGNHLALIPGQQRHQLTEKDCTGQLSQLDVVFPVVHGTLGEDGSLQGLLRVANLPFVGSDVLGSAVSMDKDVAKRLLRDAGLRVTPSVTLRKSRRSALSFTMARDQLGLPLFIKPASQGSSVGVSKVTTSVEFEQALSLAFTFDNKVLIEQAIIGKEIECAVLGNDIPQASLCGEVILNDSFYRYETKYINADGATIQIPADISSAASEAIRTVALTAFDALECRGMARVDVFLTSDQQIVVNEVNTIPGFTNISMYPKLWQASGMSYPELLTRLIELAVERYQQNSALKSSLSP